MTPPPEILYMTWRGLQDDPTSLPPWGNLDAIQRTVWDSVFHVAKNLVTEANANKLGEAVVRITVPIDDIDYEADGVIRAVGSSYMLRGVAWAAQHLRGKV